MAERTSTANRQKAAAKRAGDGAMTTTALHHFPEVYLLRPDISAADIEAAVDGVVNIHLGEARFNNTNVGDGIALCTDDGWYVGEVIDKTDAQWEQGENGPAQTEEARLTLQVV